MICACSSEGIAGVHLGELNGDCMSAWMKSLTKNRFYCPEPHKPLTSKISPAFSVPVCCTLAVEDTVLLEFLFDIYIRHKAKILTKGKTIFCLQGTSLRKEHVCCLMSMERTKKFYNDFFLQKAKQRNQSHPSWRAYFGLESIILFLILKISP